MILKHRPIESASIAIAITAFIAATGCGIGDRTQAEEIAARPAKIVTVGTGETAARTYPGRVQAAQRVPLAFRVGGPVIEVRVSKGQQVASGELLARIDPRDYEVQVKNLEAQLAAARAQRIQASEEYRRVRGLFEHDNASKSDFDHARTALDVSAAQLRAAEQGLRAARLALADTELRAPYAGTVADRLIEAHETVAPGQPVLRFQDMRALEVIIDVPEREISALTGREPTGIRARFDAISGAETFSARVKEFATETDSQTQTFPVTLELENMPSSDLLPGMTASVEWLTGNGESHPLVVPLSSVAADGSGQTFVWRVDPDSMELSRVRVTTGDLTGSGIEILSGLESGDQVLAAGVHFVTEGQVVRPLDDQARD